MASHAVRCLSFENPAPDFRPTCFPSLLPCEDSTAAPGPGSAFF
jgi:hypothetical protein